MKVNLINPVDISTINDISYSNYMKSIGNPSLDGMFPDADISALKNTVSSLGINVPLADMNMTDIKSFMSEYSYSADDLLAAINKNPKDVADQISNFTSGGLFSKNTSILTNSLSDPNIGNISDLQRKISLNIGDVSSSGALIKDLESKVKSSIDQKVKELSTKIESIESSVKSLQESQFMQSNFSQQRANLISKELQKARSIIDENKIAELKKKSSEKLAKAANSFDDLSKTDSKYLANIMKDVPDSIEKQVNTYIDGAKTTMDKMKSEYEKVKLKSAVSTKESGMAGRPIADPNSLESQCQTWRQSMIDNRYGCLPKNTDGKNYTIEDYGDALAKVETGGETKPYSAVGPAVKKGMYKGQSAIGKYQIMEGNIPSWTKDALGRAYSVDEFKNSPEAQEATFKHRFGGYVTKYGNPYDAASVWFTGRPLSSAGNVTDGYLNANQYVSKFSSYLGSSSSGVCTNQGAKQGKEGDYPVSQNPYKNITGPHPKPSSWSNLSFQSGNVVNMKWSNIYGYHKDAGYYEADLSLLTALNDVGKRLGITLHILSAYRPPEYNSRIGGAKGSYHMKGRAFDVSMSGVDKELFNAYARAAGFNAVVFYPSSNFTHVDNGPKRSWKTS